MSSRDDSCGVPVWMSGAAKNRRLGQLTVLGVVLLVVCGVVGGALLLGGVHIKQTGDVQETISDDVDLGKKPRELAELAGWDPAGEHGLYENVYREHPTNVQPGMKPGEEPLLEFKTVDGKPFNPCTPEVEARFADRGIYPIIHEYPDSPENFFNCSFSDPFDVISGMEVFIGASEISRSELEQRNLIELPSPYVEDPDVIFYSPMDSTCGIVKNYDGGMFTVATMMNLYGVTPEVGCEKMKDTYIYVVRTLGVKT